MEEKLRKQEIEARVQALIRRLKGEATEEAEDGFAEIYIASEGLRRPEQAKGELFPRQDIEPPGFQQDALEEGPGGGWGQALVPDREEREKRDLFMEMRQISRNMGFGDSTRIQGARFYRQAQFMAHYEDDFQVSAPFSTYFPSYQMMGYEQLRTYFSWRTKVRKGVVEPIAASYVYLYLYELLNNVGVESGSEGLSRLLMVWERARGFVEKLDRYLKEWVKEYFVVKNFDCSFDQLLGENPFLQQFFPLRGEGSLFGLYAPLSAYPFRKSVFFTKAFEETLASCFGFVVEQLQGYLKPLGVKFDQLVFYGRRGTPWSPFEKAVYFPPCDKREGSKTVGISETEVYWFEKGGWYASKGRVNRDNGRFLVGFLFKRIEEKYRQYQGFKYKLKADPGTVDFAQYAKWKIKPEAFLQQVDEAIALFHQASQRITVEVNPAQLETIRTNALRTQAKLTAPLSDGGAALQAIPYGGATMGLIEPTTWEHPPVSDPEGQPVAQPPVSDPKGQPVAQPLPFKGVEREALGILLEGGRWSEVEALCRERGLLPQVLADGINEKALALLGDTVLDDEMEIYPEYAGDLKRVICSEPE